MKKAFLLAIIILCIAVSGYSQAITIAESDIASIGDTMSQRTDTTSVLLAPGPGGVSQTWDFSTLASDETKQISVVVPSTLPCGYRFPNANIAMSYPGIVNNYYFSKTATAVANVGMTMDLLGNGDTICLILSKPDTMIKFPATYNSANSVYSYGNTKSRIHYTVMGQTVDSARIAHHSNKSVKFDGWGTLTMPNGTVGALRQLVHTYTVDTAFPYIAGLGGWQTAAPFIQVQTGSTIQYIWWTNLAGAAIVNMSWDSIGSKPSSIDWLYVANLGVQPHNPMADLDFFPNPANDMFSIQAEPGYNQIMIFDVTGKEVYNAKQSNGENISINTSGLIDGIYFLKLSGKNVQPVTRKFIVQH